MSIHSISFDQWGVELGKVLAERTISNLKARTNRSSRMTARPTRSSAAIAGLGWDVHEYLPPC